MARVSTAHERDLASNFGTANNVAETNVIADNDDIASVNVVASNDSIVERVLGGAPALAHVSDDELLASTRRLVGKSNQLLAGPHVYQMQFSTVEEHVHLVERAKALLARTRPKVTLGELHLEAMKLLVTALEKRKFAVNEPKRQRGEAPEGREAPTEAPRQRVEASDVRDPPNEAPGEAPRQRVEASERCKPPTQAPPQRSRYVPAAVRREVYERDGARCTYVDARGLRCCETRYLELHHLQPFAKNGGHVASNLTLRCSAHNALAAEADFGGIFVAERRGSSKHEAFSRTRVERRSSS